MKNITFLCLAVFILWSCKKENTQETSSENLQDSATAVVPEESVETNFALAEVTPAAASELLNHKKNDTLYITNFFATWCGPCMREIPHFRTKMDELKNQPVKFTFISLDQKSDWETEVKKFAGEHQLEKNILLLDGQKLGTEFFDSNFKNWRGESIPFTYFKKGSATEEFVGMMTPTELDKIISSFK